MASTFMAAISSESAYWARYNSIDVVNELIMTSVGSDGSYGLPSL